MELNVAASPRASPPHQARSASSPPTRRAATLARQKIDQAMAPPPPSQESSPTPSPSPQENVQEGATRRDQNAPSSGREPAPLPQLRVKEELKLYERAEAAIEILAEECTQAGGVPTVSKPNGAPVVTCGRKEGHCPFRAVVRKINRRPLWFIDVLHAHHDHTSVPPTAAPRASLKNERKVGAKQKSVQAILDARSPLAPHQDNRQETEASSDGDVSRRLEQANLLSTSSRRQGVASTPTPITSAASWLPQLTAGEVTSSLPAGTINQVDLVHGLCFLGKLAQSAESQHGEEQDEKHLPQHPPRRDASLAPSASYRAPSKIAFTTARDSQPQCEEHTSARWPASFSSRQQQQQQQQQPSLEPATFPNNVRPLDAHGHRHEHYESQRYREPRGEDEPAALAGQRRRLEDLDLRSDRYEDELPTQRCRHDYQEPERRYPAYSHRYSDQHRAPDERHHPYGYQAETPLRYQQRDSSRDEHPHMDPRPLRNSSESYRERGSVYHSQPRHSYPCSSARR